MHNFTHNLERIYGKLKLLSFACYVTVLLVLNIDSLIDNSTQSTFSFVALPLLCLGGTVLLPLAILYSQVSTLRLMGLHITDD